MQNDSSLRFNHLTLAKSLIEEGLIKNPYFIEAANLQASFLEEGKFRLLGSILEEYKDKLNYPDTRLKLKELIEDVERQISGQEKQI